MQSPVDEVQGAGSPQTYTNIRFRLPYVQHLAAKCCKGPRPGSESANAIVNCRRGNLPVNLAIFLLQDGGISRLRVVLRLGPDCSRFDGFECLDEKAGTHNSQAHGQL